MSFEEVNLRSRYLDSIQSISNQVESSKENLPEAVYMQVMKDDGKGLYADLQGHLNIMDIQEKSYQLIPFREHHEEGWWDAGASYHLLSTVDKIVAVMKKDLPIIKEGIVQEAHGFVCSDNECHKALKNTRTELYRIKDLIQGLQRNYGKHSHVKTQKELISRHLILGGLLNEVDDVLSAYKKKNWEYELMQDHEANQPSLVDVLDDLLAAAPKKPPLVIKKLTPISSGTLYNKDEETEGIFIDMGICKPPRRTFPVKKLKSQPIDNGAFASAVNNNNNNNNIVKIQLLEEKAKKTQQIADEVARKNQELMAKVALLEAELSEAKKRVVPENPVMGRPPTPIQAPPPPSNVPPIVSSLPSKIKIVKGSNNNNLKSGLEKTKRAGGHLLSDLSKVQPKKTATSSLQKKEPGLLDQIELGVKLNDANERVLSKKPEQKVTILSQIQAGIQLKAAKDRVLPDPKPETQSNEGTDATDLLGAVAKHMTGLRSKVAFSSDEESNSDDDWSDEDWSDEDF